MKGRVRGFGSIYRTVTPSPQPSPQMGRGGTPSLSLALLPFLRIGLALYALQRRAPLLLDGPRLGEREHRGRRESVDPCKGAAGFDDQLRMRGDVARSLRRGNARIERRTPGAADDVDLLRRLAAGGDRPHDVVGGGRIDVVIHDDDQARHVAVRGGNERGALGMAVVALL